MYIIGIYILPSIGVFQFEESLELLEAECLGRLSSRPTILAGDFNAKSFLWGSTH